MSDADPAKSFVAFDDFTKLDLRVGTVRRAEPNRDVRNPAFVLEIDFGARLGKRTSSAQLTRNYSADELVGRQVVCVVNFPPKRVGGIRSEVLVLAAVSAEAGVVLLAPDGPVPDGSSVA